MYPRGVPTECTHGVYPRGVKPSCNYKAKLQFLTMLKRQRPNPRPNPRPKRSRIPIPSLHHVPYCKDVPRTPIRCLPGPKRENTYPPLMALKRSLSDTTSQWGIRLADNIWVLGHSKGGQWRDYLQVVVNNQMWFYVEGTALDIVPNGGLTLTLRPQGIFNLDRKAVTLGITPNFNNIYFLMSVFTKITALRQRMNSKLILQYLGSSNVSIKCEHQYLTITKPLPFKLGWEMPRIPSERGGFAVTIFHVDSTLEELQAIFPTSVHMYQSNILEHAAKKGANGKEWNLREPMWLRGQMAVFISQNANLAIRPDIFIDPSLPLQQRWAIWKNTRPIPTSYVKLSIVDTVV